MSKSVFLRILSLSKTNEKQKQSLTLIVGSKMFGSPASALRRNSSNPPSSITADSHHSKRFPSSTQPAKMTRPSSPPSLVSRNVLINRYHALESDSKRFDLSFQKSSVNTPAHTSTCAERERSQRKRIKGPAIVKKKVNAEQPKEVSVGSVGRDLTLLSMVQQLDLNVCGTDLCAMDLKAARNQHVTDLIDHSRADYRWTKNPFVQNKMEELPREASRKISPPIDDNAIRSAVHQVSVSDIAKARRAGALESRLRHKFHLLAEDEHRQFQAELNRAGQNQRDEDLIQDRDDPNRHLKPIIINRESSWQRLVFIGLFASELKGQIEEVKATNLLRRVFARELVRYLRRKRIAHEKHLFEERMAIASFGDNDVPSVGLMLKCFPVLKLDAEGYCSPAVMLAAALSSKRGIPLAKALSAFTNNISHQQSQKRNQRNGNDNDDDDYDDDGDDDGPHQQRRKTGGGGGGGGLHGMTRLRISPEHLSLLASCFTRKVFRKKEPICWSPPPSLHSTVTAASSKFNQPNSWDDDAHNARARRSNNSNSVLDTDWWYDCDSEIHLIQSGIVRMVYRQQRKEKSQALLLQQLSASAGTPSGNSEKQSKNGINSTAAKKQQQQQQTKAKVSKSKSEGRRRVDQGDDGDGDDVADEGDAVSSLKLLSSKDHLRNTIAGVETLTTGRIVGLEALVPEQAKRYVAVADSDVATWSASVRSIMDVLSQINPFGDPDAVATDDGYGTTSGGGGGGRGGAGGGRQGKNATINGSTAANSTTTTTSALSMPLLATPEQVLAYKVEKESVIMLGKLMQRMVLLRKQEIFLAQSPPTPIFLRSCAPLLYTWSDAGLTELCRALSAVFVEKGNLVPLRRDKPNRGYNWYFVGGASQVPSEVNIPSTTAPPSHVDWVYVVVHGSVTIMGRKVYSSSGTNSNIAIEADTTNNNNNNNIAKDKNSSVPDSSSPGRSRQKLVVLDTMRPGQSFGVASCLLGTLLDTAIPSAIAASLSAAGTPVDGSGNLLLGGAAGGSGNVASNNYNLNPNATATTTATAATPSTTNKQQQQQQQQMMTMMMMSNPNMAMSNPQQPSAATRHFFASGKHVASAASLLTAQSIASNVSPSQLSHLVGVELHATQDSVLWRLDKNVLMHVLAHEHIGTLLSPFSLYQQLGKPAGSQ